MAWLLRYIGLRFEEMEEALFDATNHITVKKKIVNESILELKFLII